MPDEYHLQGRHYELRHNGFVRFFNWTGQEIKGGSWQLTELTSGQSVLIPPDPELIDFRAELMRLEMAGANLTAIAGLLASPQCAVMAQLAGYLTVPLETATEHGDLVQLPHVNLWDLNQTELTMHVRPDIPSLVFMDRSWQPLA